MEKEIYVKKVIISERYIRFVVLYHGFLIATFMEDELERAKICASNLIFALYGKFSDYKNIEVR